MKLIFTQFILLYTLLSSSAFGYGTIRGMGQNAEHGRITRRALTCAPGDRNNPDCLQRRTLNSLAGTRGQFGAVGAPDRGRGLLISAAHCSGGDFFDTPGYPQTKDKAQKNLTNCRDYIRKNMDHAILDAAKLLDKNGNLRSRQLPGRFGCLYIGSRHARAKCNILAHLGKILHAVQDFYAHSNWSGIENQTKPLSVENPIGLGNVGPSPWLALRDLNAPFPQGLISGCFDKKSFQSEKKGCKYGTQGKHRVRHLDLAKDTGKIDPDIGHGNFERAVDQRVVILKTSGSTLENN